MKFSQVCFTAVAILGSVADAKVSLKSLFRHNKDDKAADASAPESIESEVEAFLADEEEGQRELSHAGGWCDDAKTTAKWHPTYSQGWTNGSCNFVKDCNSPGYSSELACCKAAYAGQVSGYCVSRLPSPPTTSPTKSGGLDVYYPDYGTAWPDAGCINDAPIPSGRPIYKSILACCKGAYGGQVSGVCLSQLPNPPTTSPTTAGGMADFWYADYETAWSEAGCKNTLPLPYKNVNDRPNYKTQIACCKAAYGGQMSGICISQLATPPTTSPTGSGGLDFYYPDYDTAWSVAGCLNTRPLPYKNKNDRPSYSTMIACCKGAYGGQMSGACLAQLPNPPTTSPTSGGGLKVFYSLGWNVGTCSNARPLPNNSGPTFSSKQACCNTAFAGQTNHDCDCDVDTCSNCDCAGYSAVCTSPTQVAKCAPPTNQPTPPPTP